MSQEQVANLRRTQILDAAMRVFAQRGFHRSSIRDVAREAGVADGTIYNYFENKTALLLGILDGLNETPARAAQLAQTEHTDLRTFTRQYLAQRLRFLSQENGQMLQIVLSEVLADPEIRDLYMRKIVEPTFELAEAQHQQLAAMGKFPVEDIPLRLRLISATVLGTLTLWIMGDPHLREAWDRLPDLLSTLIFDGLIQNEGGDDERPTAAQSD